MRHIINSMIIFFALSLFFTMPIIAHPKQQDKPPVTVSLLGLPGGKVVSNVMALRDSLLKQLQAPLSQEDILRIDNEFKERVPTVMKPFGYMGATISGKTQYLNGRWVLTYQVKPGPVTVVSKVTIQIDGPGKGQRYFNKLIQHFPIKIGAHLDITKYRDAKNLFYNVSSLHGYFDASLYVNKIIINTDNHTAQYVFKFKTGVHYRFGKTTLSKSPFNQSFLMRYLAYSQNQYYNRNKIEATQNRLQKSNYFQNIDVSAQLDKKKNGSVPVHITLVPRKHRAYFAGLGYGTDTGIRGMLGMNWRWLNQYGHYLKTMVRGSMKNNEFLTTYYIPGSKPDTDYYSANALFGNFDGEAGNSKVYKISLGYKTVLGANWKQYIALNFLKEDYNLKVYVPTQGRLIYPSIRLSYLNKDLQKRPNNGLSMDFNMAGTPSTLTSRSGFVQSVVNAKVLYTIKSAGLRFVLRGELGRTQIPDIVDLPLSMQLFAGGANSVRGFSYQELGPGKNLLVVSAEIQKKIYGSFYLTAFCDVGTATDNNISLSTLQKGIGPGIMLLTPLGSLELSVAQAITKPGKPWAIQFSMGPSL